MIKLSVFVGFFLLSSCLNTAWYQNDKINGNGDLISEIRDIGTYNSISCAGAINFIVVPDAVGHIEIEGESNLLKYVITEIKNENLIVKIEKNKSLISSSGMALKVIIPCNNSLDKISLAGSGDLWNDGKLITSNLDVSLAGSGDISLDIDTANMNISLAGSGNITLKGTTNNLSANLAGSGDIHSFNLETNHAEVSVAGSGDIEVVSNETLKARVSGSGDIQYKGNPIEKDSKVSGSGNIFN